LQFSNNLISSLQLHDATHQINTMITNQIKKGDILPCGGVVTFVASTGYYFTPKSGKSRQWVSTQIKADVVVDYAAVQREQEEMVAARKSYSNRDMTLEYAEAEKAKAKHRQEIARILALAGVSTHEELMGSVPWAAQYIPYEVDGKLLVYNNTGETRGVWDHATKTWVWAEQNNRGTREDVGSGYGRHAD